MDNFLHSTENTRLAFVDLELAEPLQKAVFNLGFEFCTPIQAQSLAYTLEGHDVTGRAQTGTGKTIAFLLTILNDLLSNPQDDRYIAEPRALIVAPTRELAIQIAADADDLTKFCDIHIVTLVGGEEYQKQLSALEKRTVDIVSSDNIYLGLIELLVLDEADRMLDMGFIPQVRRVIAQTPKKDCRQTLMFSATFSDEIIELAQRWAMNPVMVEVEPEKIASDSVTQMIYLITSDNKYDLLYNLLLEKETEKVIVFNNRRHQVRELADYLHRSGIDCGALSGDIPQYKRIRTLDAFKTGKLRVLVATDVAGRGLHIDDVSHVINFSLPEEPEDYVHRIGRTGRAGAIGTSISFACEEDSFLLPAIEEKLGAKLDCVYPSDHLLEPAPPFVRKSRFAMKNRSKHK